MQGTTWHQGRHSRLELCAVFDVSELERQEACSTRLQKGNEIERRGGELGKKRRGWDEAQDMKIKKQKRC